MRINCNSILNSQQFIFRTLPNNGGVISKQYERDALPPHLQDLFDCEEGIRRRRATRSKLNHLSDLLFTFIKLEWGQMLGIDNDMLFSQLYDK